MGQRSEFADIRERPAPGSAPEHAAFALLELSTQELTRRAREVRAAASGTRVTYSPKVFNPLTRLCRDRCGYCTFATAPRSLPAPYLTLAAMCAQVIEETGLLPHANAGALTREELALLRGVSVSQGSMVETLRADLAAHRGAPDKTPERRLGTLTSAGELSIPFTTGILVGIGEDEHDRVEALLAIAQSHREFRHVQEVIVQNFLPKPGTAMRGAPACPPEDHQRAIALARLVLPPDVHVQAPPNLTDVAGLGALLDAGIDDWGGVSPVTADHVNPERPWPAVEALREVTEAAGLTLAPRLTAYPEFIGAGERWIDQDLRFAAMDRSDAHGLARDDPGAMWPERHQAAANVGTGAEVVQVGRRSTSWYSGADTDPQLLIHADSRRSAVRWPRSSQACGQVSCPGRPSW